MVKARRKKQSTVVKSEQTPNDSNNHDSNRNNDNYTTPRIELFFTSPGQLKERVNLLQSHGYHKFNLVNKNAQDTLLDWTTTIREACPTAHICAHYSLKYNKVPRKGNDAHVGLLQEFTTNGYGQVNEILLVSGGHNLSKPRPKWNTVQALQQLKSFTIPDDPLPTLAVAYNPYIPEESKQQEETQRLQEKLQTGLVSKVYLQFGTDLVKLQQALKFLESFSNIQLAGSLFLPTKQLIAQQKFRPWNGVFLSKEFLEGPESATGIVVEILKLYHSHRVEALWEAPGIRTAKDLQLLTELSLQAEKEGEVVDASEESGTGTEHGQESLFSLMMKDDDKDDRTENKKPKPLSPATKRQKTLTESGFTRSSSTSKALPSVSTTCLLLFGPHDLRLYDNKAVHAACQEHSIVVPVFLWSPYAIQSGGIRAEALEVMIHDALNNLSDELEAFGLELICRSCPTASSVEQELTSLLRETGAIVIHYNRDFTPNGRQLESLRQQVVEKEPFRGVVRHKGHQSTLLYDIDLVDLKKGFHGGHWGTLMPFYNNCKRNYGLPRRPIPTHETFGLLQRVKGPGQWPVSRKDSLPLAMLPPKARPWHQGIRKAFPNISYKGAQEDLDAFFDSNHSGFRRYGTERSRADKERSTSRLSAHLRVGTLSPNELYWRHEDHPVDNGIFSRRLVWRDLAYYQLRCFPKMSTLSIRSHYEKTSWCTGEEAERRFRAWKTGQTGYPMVDAGMRELWATGWMNQSVRMVCAYFLVEYLRVSWVKGCEWFHYTLVDADSAINAMMWQNAGKSGVDQWNFVLSPESGSQDPTGRYVQKWIPELSRLPLDMGLHRPWETPKPVLERYGVSLGKNYPCRIVTQLKQEREKSIDSIINMRRNSQEFNDSRGYDLLQLPNGEKTVVFTLKQFRIDRSGKLMPSEKRANRENKNRGARKSKLRR